MGVTIQVDDDGVGNLTAMASYSGSIAFENETKPGTLTITKTTNGSGTGDELFTFEVRLNDAYGRPFDSVNIVTQPAA